MYKLLYLLLVITLFSCGGTSEEQSEDGTKEMEELVSNYKKVPAFPFQFTYEDLYTEPKELSNEQQENYFDLGEGVSVQALHYYVVGENYVLFTMSNPVPMPANGQVLMQVDMFSKKGEKLGSIAPLPYQASHMEYKSNPKFEVYEDAISFITEEIYFIDEPSEGPIDGLPDQVEFRSFYADSYNVTLDGFEQTEKAPFWMKIPRNYFSPFVVDYLRHDGVFDHIVSETENSIQITDKLDKQYRASFYQFKDGVIGISSTFEDERTEKIISTLNFIELKDQTFTDRTEEIINKHNDLFLAQKCDCSEINTSNTLMHALTRSGTRSNFPYVEFKDSQLIFYCLDSKAEDITPSFTLKYQGGSLRVDD